MSETNTRPTIKMTNHRGRVVAAFAIVTDRGGAVEVWCDSPTGGQTDSQIFHIDCLSIDQAEAVANMWQTMWGLAKGDATVPANRPSELGTPMA
jgi:hypothetical protein